MGKPDRERSGQPRAFQPSQVRHQTCEWECILDFPTLTDTIWSRRTTQLSSYCIEEWWKIINCCGLSHQDLWWFVTLQQIIETEIFAGYSSQGSLGKQNQEQIYKGTYYRKLSRDYWGLQLASWRPRIAGGVVPAWVWVWKAENLLVLLTGGISSSPRSRPMSSSKNQAVRVNSPFLHFLFYFFIQAFTGLDEAHSHWGGQSALLGPDSDVNLIQKYLHGYTRNNV